MGLFSRTKDRKRKKAAKEAQASTVADADVSTGTKTTVVEEKPKADGNTSAGTQGISADEANLVNNARGYKPNQTMMPAAKPAVTTTETGNDGSAVVNTDATALSPEEKNLANNARGYVADQNAGQPGEANTYESNLAANSSRPVSVNGVAVQPEVKPAVADAEMVGKDLAKALEMMPDGPEKEQAIQNALTTGKVAWQEILDARIETKKYLDENGNVDPKKLEEEEKRQKRNRNIIGITNMIGALGNLANATSSRDGRSVEVADLVKPYDEAQQKEYDKREKSLKRLRDAQKNYGDASANIINQGWKDYQTRKQREFDNAIKEQNAKDKAAKAAADLRAANARADEYMAKAIIAKGNAATAEELAQLKVLTAKARLRQIETSISNSRNSNTHTIPYDNGSNGFNISKDKWNPTSIGEAWRRVPPALQDKIINDLVDDIDRGDESVIAETSDPETKDAFGQVANAGSKAAKKKQITENKALLEIAIGMAVDEEGGEFLREYLGNLSGQKYENKAKDYTKKNESNGGIKKDYR